MPDRRDARVAALFLVAAAAGIVMAFRAQCGGDQLNLLRAGWLIVEQGYWRPFGNPTSGGGFTPGNVTAGLIGAAATITRRRVLGEVALRQPEMSRC